jgi:hypothetical protein
MEFRQPDRPIFKFYTSNAFEFTPSTGTVQAPQTPYLSKVLANDDCLDVRDVTSKLEVHLAPLP